MFAIKNVEENSLFCGWHAYVCYTPNGIERWNDTFPYYEGNKSFYPVEYYETREEAEKVLETLYSDIHVIVEVDIEDY